MTDSEYAETLQRDIDKAKKKTIEEFEKLATDVANLHFAIRKIQHANPGKDPSFDEIKTFCESKDFTDNDCSSSFTRMIGFETGEVLDSLDEITEWQNELSELIDEGTEGDGDGIIHTDN